MWLVDDEFDESGLPKTSLALWVVELSSGSSVRYCPIHGRMSCPICGSELVVVKYNGNERRLLALAGSDGFHCFLGCLRVNLHDKVVDGVNHRGKVFIRTVFHERVRARY